MDHVVQIPGVGPEWEDMPESTTVLGFLAAATERVQLGALVNGVTYRNLAQLGKQVATLDVLSGGRAFCGLGAGVARAGARALRLGLPAGRRALRAARGRPRAVPAPVGTGRRRGSRAAPSRCPRPICYPRPLQERIPIIVGGSGERRTLRLVARHADGCNLFGEPDVVAHKVAVLHAPLRGRGPRPGARSPSPSCRGRRDRARAASAYADVVGTVEEQIGRYRALADAGVQRGVRRRSHDDGTDEQATSASPR